MLAPLSSAQDAPAGDAGGDDRGAEGEPGNSAHGHDQGNERSDDRGPRDEPEEPDAIDLDAVGDGDHAKLDWVMHGRVHRVQSFEVYRSENGAPAQLVATLDASARSYVDSQVAAVGAYTYSVMAMMEDGTTTQSNQSSAVIGGGVCQWVSVSPAGSPPVIFHDECSPFHLEGILF